VPLLGDIPVVGYAFKNTTRRNDRTELLVFLTPRVVTDSSLAR
jgi:type IV pilus assembly protein PilQ